MTNVKCHSLTPWGRPEVKFARDASGRIDRVIFGGGRITGITFRKVVLPETP